MPRGRDFAPDVLEAFERHNWPGNVRELRNVMERAVILAGEGAIETQAPAGVPAERAAMAAARRWRRLGGRVQPVRTMPSRCDSLSAPPWRRPKRA